MDERTLHAYSARARDFGSLYQAQTPTRLYALVQAFFHPGGRTADIGTGSGRDTAWLAGAGFAPTGFDASPEMLAEARAFYPDLSFVQAALPELAGIADGAFDNLLCSATLMHVRREDMITAVLNLARILATGGRLLISYRQSRSTAEREPDGRLFTAIAPGELALLFESAGLQLLQTTSQPDASRVGIDWTVQVYEKSGLSVSRGLERIQAVLAQDRKVATYKFALIRALCAVSRTRRHLVRWTEAGVSVPLWSLAVEWLIFYWPLVNCENFIAQIQAESATGTNQIAFRSTLKTLAALPDIASLPDLLRQLDEEPERFRPALRKIAETIRAGPVTHAGSKETPVFSFHSAPRRADNPEVSFGWVVVPEAVWLDICRFEHWIEDSIVVRWARMTAELNRNEPGGMGLYLPLLLQTPADERDTAEVRQLLHSSNTPLLCVWTGAPLSRSFHVDHLLPYSVWGNNDLWNLLPCRPEINLKKSDCLPKLAALDASRTRIVAYWQQYHALRPHRFAAQVQRALGCRITQSNWQERAFAGLVENIERLATSRGLRRWP